MLGKRSRPMLCTSSKLSFPPEKDCAKHPSVTVFGFHIPQAEETKPPDACESPRSVLDVNVQVPLEKHPQSRSFRSCVRALPLWNRGSQGVGLAIIVNLHAEEKRDHGRLPQEASMREPPQELNLTSFCLQSFRHHHHHHHHQRSEPIAIAGSCRSKDQPSTYKLSKYVESPGAEDDDDDDSSSVGSVLDMEFLGSDDMPLWQEYVVHNKESCNADNNENSDIRASIFSVASIPSNHGSFGIQPVSYLDACVLCQRAFAPGKDIFMYRGDQAFCSTECRGEKIKIDEYNEKLITRCA